MAKKVTAVMVGGQTKVIEANTVQDAYDALGLTGSYTATINGDAADMDDELVDFYFVSFAEKVKGGC